MGGNYAPTIQPQVQAAERHGVPQVLYTFKDLDQHADEAVFEECGAMNIFFYMRQRDGHRVLVTPALGGTILPGITRDSILQLARSWGEEEVGAVEERPVTIAEVREAHQEGRLLEVFGSGTACVIQPMGSLIRATGEVFTTAPFDPEANLSVRLQRTLLDIQYGRVEHPWSVAVE